MTNPTAKTLQFSAERDERPPHSRATALDMKSAIIKRSIELHGHKTSVSLEDEFWTALRSIAHAQNISLPALLQIIDQGREGANLSSAIRVHVLSYYRAQAEPATPGPRLPPALLPSLPPRG
jgi:predicted DNA-binding ribbon-helix-helix protein